MRKPIEYIKQLPLIKYLIQLQRFIGHKIYLVFALILIVGFFEGIGITLFLPILQNGFGNDRLSHILKSIFDFLHIGFSFKGVLGFIVVFFILRGITFVRFAKFFGKVCADLVISLRSKVLKGVFSARYIYLLKKEMGYINNIMGREIVRVADTLDSFVYTTGYAIYALVYITLAALLNFSAVFILIAFSLIPLVIMRILNSRIREVSREFSFSYGKFHSILIQALSKLKYLKATLSNKKISPIIDKENNKLGSLQRRLFYLQAGARNILELFVVFVAVGVLFVYVVWWQRSISEVIFLTFLFLQIARQFSNAQTSYRKFVAAIGSIETFNDFLKELEENKEDLIGTISPDFKKDITFRDVTVIFPNGKKGLDGVNINIKPKSTVAFVGHSGSGKSTAANMITGILRPTKGRILFGGTDYDRLNVKALRKDIGYITQEDVIFNASIKDNVSLWGENIDENRLAKVIEMAHIRGFVNDLPEKSDSMLGDNGLDISGGQRQRITIARELYKDAKLLILDEATSSLDSKSEKQIYENLKEFKGNKTMVVIAHRLSTVKNADYTYVLDEGKIVEEGTYEELYKKRGEFTKMIEDQKLI